MRIFLLLLCALSVNLSQAQPGGGGMMGGGQRGGMQGQGQGERQPRKMVEFNAAKIVGIFNYDDTEAVKKIKLKSKKEAALILDVRKAINKYNQSVNEIALNNKDNFDTLNVYMNTIMKASRPKRGEQSDYGMQDDQENPMRKAKKLAEAKMEPAKKAIQEEEIKLNAKLEALLSEKQNKKWLKYQEAFKKELEPEEKSENNSNMSRGGGQGGPPGGGGRMR